ncbi:extracellular solute-binding protein [Catelliglobosispora koreensis]|uniref:extracellular solute-binding protein n=1 Tax=Catelliglobosispora koreensis TaxID=129052 RepID=UPI000378E58C|nr:extracellular solute-binding protein [Catelliglobosispora koreensis]
MDRRSLLKLVGAGALATTGVPLLSACGTGTDNAGVSNVDKALTPWPTYVPFAGPTPDGAPDATGVQALYKKYPAKLVKAVDGKPGDGSKIKAMVITYGTPPKAAAENKFWDAVNKALGVDIELILVPDADFKKKMATMMASNDLPDMIMFGGGYQLGDEQQFIAAQCEDLSAHLGGDNVKAYPALANIPPYSWQGMGRIGGKIYGVPIERPMPGNQLIVNRTALDAAGVPKTWSSADEFVTSMKKLNGDKKYAIGASAQSLTGGATNYHASSFGAPNTWKADGGKFVHMWETAEFKAGLEVMIKMAAAGLYYPDSSTVSQTDLKTHFYNQTVATFTDGYGAWTAASDAVAGKFAIDFALPYTKDAKVWQGSGRFGYVTLKKAPAERIKMLLRVMNYLAAPFGTQEYELVNFGVEGTHFTRGTDGGIVKTELAKTENNTNVPVKYIAAAPSVLYYPGGGETAQRIYDWEKAALKNSIADPSNGLMSNTWTSQSAAFRKPVEDAIAAIVMGRRPLSDWDGLVKTFKSAGADKAAEEYAKEKAAAEKA